MGTRLTSTHNLCFEQKYENYQNFSSENFHILVVKISVYLNRHVFTMWTSTVEFEMQGTDNMANACAVLFERAHFSSHMPRREVCLDHSDAPQITKLTRHHENTPI